MDNTNQRIALLSLAGGLGVGFFSITMDLWSLLRPFGDILVALTVITGVLAASLNGYWQGSPALSAIITSLVAGGHLLGEYMRTMHAVRLPPVQTKYYGLWVGLALGVGFGAHYLGRWVASEEVQRA